jgi:SP family myo-inositol transporter-like MFS transporter 13
MTDTAAEPLIYDHGHGSDYVESNSDVDVDESTLVRPGIFIWVLTFCAGVSGLLFGYEYVPLKPFCTFRNVG